MSDLGDLLITLRGKRSLREAAKKAGISHTYLSIIEKGVDLRSGTPVKPTPETLMALSEAYNYPYEQLMIKAGYWSEEEKIEDERSPAEKLISFLDMKLSNEEIVKLMNFKVDGMTLTFEEAIEFVEFVRVKRLMKKQQPTGARAEGP